MFQLKSFISSQQPQLLQFAIKISPVLIGFYLTKVKNGEDVSEIESFFIYLTSQTYQPNVVYKIPFLQKPSIYYEPILSSEILSDKVVL